MLVTVASPAVPKLDSKGIAATLEQRGDVPDIVETAHVERCLGTKKMLVSRPAVDGGVVVAQARNVETGATGHSRKD